MRNVLGMGAEDLFAVIKSLIDLVGLLTFVNFVGPFDETGLWEVTRI